MIPATIYKLNSQLLSTRTVFLAINTEELSDKKNYNRTENVRGYT